MDQNILDGGRLHIGEVLIIVRGVFFASSYLTWFGVGGLRCKKGGRICHDEDVEG